MVLGFSEERPLRMRKRYEIKDSVKGVVITQVSPNSPAADKGIKEGDVVVEINQEPVAAPADGAGAGLAAAAAGAAAAVPMMPVRLYICTYRVGG